MVSVIERFSVTCRKNKTEIITLIKHNRRKQLVMNQLSNLEANTCNRGQSREYACDQITCCWVSFSLVDIMAQASFVNQSQSVVSKRKPQL